MATTLDVSPDIALPRLVIQPVHRPAQKRLVPYVCIRQNDLPDLLPPRFEAPDGDVQPYLEDGVYRVLWAPRGDPRPLASMFLGCSDVALATKIEPSAALVATRARARDISAIEIDVVRARSVRAL